MIKGTISILGCGWLGLPLAKQFIQDGYFVKGSVTRTEKFDSLRNSGIPPYKIVLNSEEIAGDISDFFNCDVLIISIPPRRIDNIEKIFPAQIAQLISFILKSEIRKVIFISSTSVYPERLQVAKEEDSFLTDKASGKALLEAEKMLENNPEFRTTVIRFGGLIGDDRNPARFLQKSARIVPNTPVNLIHQDDCIGIISSILEKEIWGETFNACCPEHPMKKEFYGKAAQLSGLPEPLISDQQEAFKIVDSSKLIRLLKYKFKYPSPMDYLDILVTNKK